MRNVPKVNVPRYQVALKLSIRARTLVEKRCRNMVDANRLSRTQQFAVDGKKLVSDVHVLVKVGVPFMQDDRNFQVVTAGVAWRLDYE